MANVSTKITANTTITSDNSLFFGVIITADGTATPGTTIEVYNGTSSSGTHVSSLVIALPSSTNIYRGLTIKCNAGLRIESGDWTGVTLFVLHAWGVING